MFHAHVGLVAAHPGLPRVLFHELQSTGGSPVRAAVRSLIADYRRRLARLFDQAKAAGEVPLEIDSALATVLFIGAVQGLVIQAALTDGEATLGRHARRMFALLLDGYRGADPASKTKVRSKRRR